MDAPPLGGDEAVAISKVKGVQRLFLAQCTMQQQQLTLVRRDFKHVAQW
jgi:hypothetical protein